MEVRQPHCQSRCFCLREGSRDDGKLRQRVGWRAHHLDRCRRSRHEVRLELVCRTRARRHSERCPSCDAAWEMQCRRVLAARNCFVHVWSGPIDSGGVSNNVVAGLVRRHRSRCSKGMVDFRAGIRQDFLIVIDSDLCEPGGFRLAFEQKWALEKGWRLRRLSSCGERWHACTRAHASVATNRPGEVVIGCQTFLAAAPKEGAAIPSTLSLQVGRRSTRCILAVLGYRPARSLVLERGSRRRNVGEAKHGGTIAALTCNRLGQTSL